MNATSTPEALPPRNGIAPPPLTQDLARFTAQHPSGAWDEATEQAALRTILNWLGCAIGAANHPAVDAAVAAMLDLDPPKSVTVLGRRERMDAASAALVNGISSHVFDYDDTHPATLIHPSGPIVAAALAVAERYDLSGRALIDAVVLGVDVACRAGLLVCPEHYDRGWHVTGSAGVLGAAAAVARLLEMDAQMTTMALGLAASQPIGLREQFGSMAKPFHPGAAARAGLTSALLARRGFTSAPTALEGKRGYAQVLSEQQHWDRALSGLGKHFEIVANTFKPYACGLVIHPCIDACLTLRARHGLQPADIASVALRVHPLVLELTGKTQPRTGLDGKFSVFHACAAALVRGAAGIAEFQQEAVDRPEVVALRRRITATAENGIPHEAAHATILCKDGRSLTHRVDHALGSLERPMSDRDLDIKFAALVEPVLGNEKAAQLQKSCWALAEAGTLRSLLDQARP